MGENKLVIAFKEGRATGKCSIFPTYALGNLTALPAQSEAVTFIHVILT